MNDFGTRPTTHDARAVANLLLERARARGLEITPLALQKLIYFAHGWMLTRHGRPLVDGYFEAWKHGPVHPALYACFRGFGRDPITRPAERLNLRTGELTIVEPPADAEVTETIDRVLEHLGALPPTRLVNISHARGGPWSETVNKRPTETRLGLRISDTLVCERFHRHMVMGSADEPIGDIVEEAAPPA